MKPRSNDRRLDFTPLLSWIFLSSLMLYVLIKHPHTELPIYPGVIYFTAVVIIGTVLTTVYYAYAL